MCLSFFKECICQKVNRNGITRGYFLKKFRKSATLIALYISSPYRVEIEGSTCTFNDSPKVLLLSSIAL